MQKETLSSVSISKGLKSRFIGQRVLYYHSVTSTNDIARREAQRGVPEGTVVIAERQTAGRGRMERVWHSPRGNIAISLILHPDLLFLPSLIMLASLAVSHSIQVVTGIKTQIKWPNDVLINGKKVCGILIESDLQGSKVNYSIIGIGINVNINLADFPEIQSIATSLSSELGREVSRLALIRSLLVEMEKLYLSGSIFEEWRDNLITLGKRVRATSGETVSEGIAESVNRDGSLLLRGADGSITRIVAGDVTLRE